MDDSSDKSRNGLADERTNWAEDRTLLANERTFAGWISAALTAGAVLVGIVLWIL